MFPARADQRATLEAMAAELGTAVERLSADDCRALLPILREGYAEAALIDRTAAEIDVDALHRHYLRRLTEAGGRLQLRAEVTALAPAAGILLLSPADETPSPPCDASPEELDLAIAIDRVQRAVALPVRRVAHEWAGLRSFVADKCPVVGFAPGAAGFFWLAGQGGYGIRTAPAMPRWAAAAARCRTTRLICRSRCDASPGG